MIIKQLTLGLEKLMETTSAFWIDLGYRLHSRKRLHCRAPMGWLTPCHVLVPFPILV